MSDRQELYNDLATAMQVNADRTKELEHVKAACNDLVRKCDELGAQLESERQKSAALVVQAEQLRAAYINLSGAINDIDDMEEGSEEIADAWPNLFILLQQGYEVCQATPTQCLAAQHPDDAAVDRFAMAMKTKLATARAKGRSGWDDKASCSGEHLAQLLVEHLSKGNPGTFEDVANFAMMLHQRGDNPDLLKKSVSEHNAHIGEAVLQAFINKYIEYLEESIDKSLTSSQAHQATCAGVLFKEFIDSFKAKVGE